MFVKEQYLLFGCYFDAKLYFVINIYLVIIIIINLEQIFNKIVILFYVDEFLKPIESKFCGYINVYFKWSFLSEVLYDFKICFKYF